MPKEKEVTLLEILSFRSGFGTWSSQQLVEIKVQAPRLNLWLKQKERIEDKLTFRY